MTRFRASARPVTLAALAVATVAGCTRLHLGSGNDHPRALVGLWVDSLKTSPTDTSIWLLTARGEDISLRIRKPPVVPKARVEERHYGGWRMAGHLTDQAKRAICFTHRPGRSGWTCLPFDLDSAASGTGFVRRLEVYGYKGRQSTSPRVFLEYQGTAQ
jgi:hypothetical protein